MKIIKTILFETVFKDEKNYNHCCWAVPNPKKMRLCYSVPLHLQWSLRNKILGISNFWKNAATILQYAGKKLRSVNIFQNLEIIDLEYVHGYKH